MELKLKNVTSYKKNDFTILNLAKKINILYGQNGCGKSTISNYFYNTKNIDYNECKCSSLDNYRPLVYNSKFIEDNFYNTTKQKGVFTLSKENADIEKKIFEKEGLRKALAAQYKEKKNKVEELTTQRNSRENECLESIWKKTESVRKSDLKYLMQGQLGSKKSFFNQVKISAQLSSVNLDSLANEYSELLKHKNKEIPLLTTLSTYEIPALDQELLATPIIDSSNSYLSETIKKLQNLDWVKKGKELYLDGLSCPFCQEKTISADFLQAIESIFDESYSQKVNKIKDIKAAYEHTTKNIFEKIKKELSLCELIKNEDKEKISSLITILARTADNNLESINNKIINPSTTVTLEYDVQTQIKVSQYITEINEKIEETNKKVKQFKKSENIISGKIWGAIRDFCSHEFEIFSKHEKDYKENYDKVQKDIEEISVKGRSIADEIRVLRDNVSNIETTINSINMRLKNLGITGFSIKKHSESEDKYIISRNENTENQDVYRSLSEGEKTLITFLYFLECCKGRTDKNDNDMRSAFIVIDDPISSLSQNYIYDIASMIHHEIIKDNITSKVLILTHNLYFFHELIKLAPKSDKSFKRDYYLGRITKNEFSIITEIEKNSIQNEYQSLWQVLKDAKNGKVNKIIIPNIMRNILEYYFAFVHRTDALQEELINLAKDDSNSDFKAFYRYINRGSHSDAVNITDMGDIEPSKYIDQLKKIFSITGHEKHYLKMMNEEEEENATA